MSASTMVLEPSIEDPLESMNPELHPEDRRLPSRVSLEEALIGADSMLDSQFDWERSTEDNYASSTGTNYGPYKSVRDKLDYSYHSVYSRPRQWFQDAIIHSMLNDATITDSFTGEACSSSNEPWIVFSAGAMGAGKTYTLRRLRDQGLFPLDSFVSVDPDEIRRLMPEFQVYVERNPDLAGKMTRKEAGMVAEILTKVALERGQNVLVDGSLRDVDWYKAYFQQLRSWFPRLRLGIIHVTAPADAIFERVKSRARTTGRAVPHDVLLMSMEQVPKSVEILKHEVDMFLEIHNSDISDVSKVVTKGATWGAFRDAWKQTCATEPTR